MPSSLDIKGFAELERGLSQLPDQVARKIAGQSVRKGAVVIQREARSRAPVRADDGVVKTIGKPGSRRGRLPGYLRASIVVRLRRIPGASVAYSIGWTKRAFYGSFLEFGTRFMPARPFLRPAADGKFREAVQTIGADLGPKIEREAARLCK